MDPLPHGSATQPPIVSPHMTMPHILHHGAHGHSAETWQVLLVVALVTADFLLTMERSVAAAHTLTFLSVVGTLWFTEGTLSLGSKWCTYCLIFSFVYLTDPIWGPRPEKWWTQELTEDRREYSDKVIAQTAKYKLMRAHWTWYGLDTGYAEARTRQAEKTK